MGELLDRIQRACRDGEWFGNTVWQGGKRNKPEVIQGRRLLLLNGQFEFTTKHDSELACFEMIGNTR